MHISLNLLGFPQVLIENEAMPESRVKRIEALLYYVALESQQIHRRETLVGLLFPDMPDELARTNLRQTLRRLRTNIQDVTAEPPLIITSRESTQFNTNGDYTLDVEQFNALLQGCALHTGRRDYRCKDCMTRASKAIALYRGPFLEGFFLEDSTAFDNWMMAQRESYQQRTLDALEELSDYYEQRGEYAKAVPFARRQIELEPWREEAYQQLMRLYAFQGKRAMALRLFDTMRTQLEEELGVDPLPESEALHEQIASAPEQRPFNLPQRDNTFVGRDDELGSIRLHLSDPSRRLLSLIGTGGAGKTTLSIETGWRVADNYLGPFPHGVFFVPLAGIVTPDGDQMGYNPVVTAVADAIGFTFSGPQTQERQLVAYLRDKAMLLILDNFEHLIQTGRGFVHQLIQSSTNLNLLVTSRERLRTPDEWVMELNGLPIYNDGAESQALNLFVQRAQRVLPNFDLQRAQQACSTADAIRICELVNGLPLGIELAASWVRMLTCREIVSEIEQNLDFLQRSAQAGDLDSAGQHQSLRAVFDYSWALLTPAEQNVLCEVSVFRGQFDRAGASAVVGASLPELAGLVDRSLLQHRPNHLGYSSYIMLDVLRQYASERLADQPEKAAIQQRHATYYLNFLQSQRDALIGHAQQESQADIAACIKDIRAAWRFAIQNGQIKETDQAIESLMLYFYIRSWFDEGRDTFMLLTEQMEEEQKSAETTPVYAKALAFQGWFTFLAGRQRAGQMLLQKGMQLLAETADGIGYGYAQSFLAVATYTLDDYPSAKTLAQAGLQTFTDASYAYGSAIANNILSQIAHFQQDFEAAQQYSETSIKIERTLGNRWSMGFSLVNLGRVELETGNIAAARKRFLEGLSIREALQDIRGQALCYLYLGDTAAAEDNFTLAIAQYATCYDLFDQLGNASNMAQTRLRQGDIAMTLADTEQANSFYIDALRAASLALDTGQKLMALLRLAELSAAQNNQRAGTWAMVVAQHPAVDAATKLRAERLLSQLNRPVEPRARPTLDILVSRLLDG